ncbi:MAG TPA: PEP/pyruvate-binding domain-containing protein [Acidimicrobiales bacterium]|nr:PEP/pyruvate-binding domain-containing protein [Acidimicrobiales bacterium]
MVPLVEAADASLYGGKAAQLAVAAGGGLPVPPGFALAWPLVDAVATGDDRAARLVTEACADLDGPLVVRSSAVGEDSGQASFAGQHSSVLGVNGAGAVVGAVREVRESASSEAARAYRRRLGLPDTVRVGVVVQQLVGADVAGVLFDVNPVTGADEVVVEASWGLGEAVVSGIVTPDFFRVGPDGELRERRPGVKDVELRPAPGGGTRSMPVDAERARAPSLSDDQLRQLHALAVRCREVFGGSQDVEWAFAAGDLWLLQRRPLTVAPPGGRMTPGG